MADAIREETFMPEEEVSSPALPLCSVNSVNVENMEGYNEEESFDSDITNTSGTNISNETEGNECAIQKASEDTASVTSLKTMAASIRPAKTVPPKDPVKKKKRDCEKTNDVLSQSSKDVSFLAASLGAALERFGPSQPVQPAPHPGGPNMSSDIEAMLGFVAVALNRVSEEERLSCVMDMVAVVKNYTNKHSWDYE
ncbi:uncharacterized protein LOC143907160 isoform X1 [Temnothorax americanus]|uniref:uncharacterized protein LOC143907160 isoform X1 n=1 Tax=Temnothorax americanus TaxID=1964332 RepID=UPI0040689AC6